MQVVIFTVQNIESDRSELNRISEFFFESFEIDEVREFEIKDKLGSVQFKKTGKNWFLSQNGDRVSSEKIKKFFINLKDITKFRPDIVGKTPHSNFMVGDDNYSKMITLTGSETLVLFFGRTDKTDRSYLRIEGDQQVYEVNFVLDNLVIEPELWLELKPQKNLHDLESK